MRRSWFSDPVVWLGALVGMATTAYVLFAGRYLPYIDWGNHLALISVLAHGGDTGALAYLERSFAPTPYLLFYLTTALFAQLVHVEVAAKLSIVLSGGLIVLASAWLLDTCHRSPRLALIAPLALFGISFGYGFGSFVFTMPLMLCSLAALERALDATRRDDAPRGQRRAAAVLGLFLLLTYLGHALVFLVTALLVCLRSLTRGAVLLRGERPALRRSVIAVVSAFCAPALFALPTAVAFIRAPWTETGESRGPVQVFAWEDFDRHVFQMYGHLLDRGSPEHLITMQLTVVVFVIFLVASLLRPVDRDAPKSYGLEIYALALFVLFMFGPESIGWPHAIWMVYPRFGTLAFLLIFFLPRFEPRRFWNALLVLPLALVLHNAKLNAQHVRGFSTWADRFDPVRELIPKGARVLALTVVPNGDLASLHQTMGALYFYLMADGAAYTAFLFNTPLHPVRARKDVTLPRAPFWRAPGSFSPSIHGKDFDYLVLRGQGLIDRASRSSNHELVKNVDGWAVFKTKAPSPWPEGFSPPSP